MPVDPDEAPPPPPVVLESVSVDEDVVDQNLEMLIEAVCLSIRLDPFNNSSFIVLIAIAPDRKGREQGAVTNPGGGQQTGASRRRAKKTPNGFLPWRG